MYIILILFTRNSLKLKSLITINNTLSTHEQLDLTSIMTKLTTVTTVMAALPLPVEMIISPLLAFFELGSIIAR